MDIGNLTLAAAFVVGLAHTLEPCEDKAIVSLFVFWATKRLAPAVGLVVLYGLGMALADTVMGFVLSYIGVRWLDVHHVSTIQLYLLASGYAYSNTTKTNTLSGDAGLWRDNLTHNCCRLESQ